VLLHIADDSIFLDYAIEQFEKIIPGQNIYLVNTEKPKHIKNINKIICNGNKSNEYKAYINELNKYDAVIIHALTSDKIKIVNKGSKKIIFVWMFWGADGYYINKVKSTLFSERTKDILDKLNNNPNIFSKVKQYILSKDIFNIPYSLLIKKELPADYQRRKAIRRMDFCAPVIEDDYFFIKKVLRVKCKYLPFSYGSVESLGLLNEDDSFNIKESENNRILLGNSADPSNNHIEIILALEKLKFGGEIICPLSYGNNEYASYITKIGNEVFGDKFFPILDFIPLDEYQTLVKSCNIVIMNHYRQQGMGNILSALWNRSKVFLSMKNPVYNYLIRNNVNIFNVEFDFIEFEKRLTSAEINQNKDFILNQYSSDNIMKKAKIFIDTIVNCHSK